MTTIAAMHAIERIKDGWKQFRTCSSDDFAKLIDHIDALTAENERLRKVVSATAEEPCKHTHSRWNTTFTSGTCRDCGAPFVWTNGEKVFAPAAAPEQCWCDEQGIGEPGVSCGDCPTRDYKTTALYARAGWAY